MPESTLRSSLPGTRYSTFVNSMVVSPLKISAFAFVRVDILRNRSQHPNVASLPAPRNRCILRLAAASNGREKIMGALATLIQTRHEHHARLIHARATTDKLFEILRDDAFYERPIAERHRVIFYLGHVVTFDWNLLGERAFGLRRFNRSFDQLFAFGIDPVGGGLPTDKPHDWPSRDQITAYNERLRAELDSAIEQALGPPEQRAPQAPTMLDTAIEHRLMHAETLAYMFHRLPLAMKKSVPVKNHPSSPKIRHHLVEIPEGPAT